MKLRLSVTALRTINLKGLEVVAKEQGIDLKSLPFKDAKASRKEWLAAQPPNRAPMAKNPRCVPWRPDAAVWGPRCQGCASQTPSWRRTPAMSIKLHVAHASTSVSYVVPPPYAVSSERSHLRRKIKNPERIAMSRKAPRIAVWSYGKIEYVPENELEDEAIEA